MGGKRGTLTKEFKHLAVDIYMTDAKTIKVEKWFGKKKQIAAVRTVCSHIKNMFKGLTLGYLYKMRAVYAISPSTVPSLREAPSLRCATSSVRSSSGSRGCTPASPSRTARARRMS